MVKEARPDRDAKSDSREDANITPAEEASIEEEMNSYADEKVVEHDNLATRPN